MQLLNRKTGIIIAVDNITAHTQEIRVKMGEAVEKAVNYRRLTGDVAEGDLVQLNTTAVDLGLGTGGVHFVMARLGSATSPPATDRRGNAAGSPGMTGLDSAACSPGMMGLDNMSSSLGLVRLDGAAGSSATMRLDSAARSLRSDDGTNQTVAQAGHIMKLRYTPLQFSVLSVEEEKSIHHHTMQTVDTLENMPVMVASLHSLVAPIAVTFRHWSGSNKRLVYIMTDGAALPLAFSHLVQNLTGKGFISTTITVGHAFGGDLEAVNIYSGLLAARHVAKADACVVAMGPGIVGTGTPWGTTALETAAILDAVEVLGGRPVAVPRISFADRRSRHWGMSHHTLTVLGRLCHARCYLPLPLLEENQLQYVHRQMEECGLTRHNVAIIAGDCTVRLLETCDMQVTSMGRTPQMDPAFFRAGGAAGRLVADWVCSQ